MQRVPKGAPKEFREQAVKLVMEEELTLPEVGRRLSLSPKTLANWVRTAQRGELGEPGVAVVASRCATLVPGGERAFPGCASPASVRHSDSRSEANP